jgi:lipopolysaccharide export system protein LptA
MALVLAASLMTVSAGGPGAWGAETSQAGTAQPAGRSPIRIQSHRLEADMNADTAEFSGEVRMGDDDFTLTADRLTIFFKSQTQGPDRLRKRVSTRDADKIVARGRVVIRSLNFTVSSDGAEYEPDAGRATLWGEKTAAPRAPSPGSVSAVGPAGGTVPSAGRVRVVIAPSVNRR